MSTCLSTTHMHFTADLILVMPRKLYKTVRGDRAEMSDFCPPVQRDPDHISQKTTLSD